MAGDSPVDLRSDTVTRPTPQMREAMAKAEVGDDVFGEDPTVNALQERAADLLGKETALFVPTGTMANLLAVLSQTQPGDTVILHEDAHPFNYESGGLGMVAGVMTKTLGGPSGIVRADDVASAIVLNDDHHFSHTTLVCIENTTNRGGGACYPVETITAVGQVAKSSGIRMHCDGARLWNASVATGVQARDYVAACDTVSCCFSKGLGAPVGSVLAGERDTIRRAHRFRKMLGGGMRQAGVVAAAALYALDHHLERLAEDHRRAAKFRSALEDVPGLRFPMASPTNIVFVDVPNAYEVIGDLASRGVFAIPVNATRIRAVFHLDIDDGGLSRAVDAFKIAAQASQ